MRVPSGDHAGNPNDTPGSWAISCVLPFESTTATVPVATYAIDPGIEGRRAKARGGAGCDAKVGLATAEVADCAIVGTFGPDEPCSSPNAATPITRPATVSTATIA